MYFSIFAAEKKNCILHGHVFIMRAIIMTKDIIDCEKWHIASCYKFFYDQFLFLDIIEPSMFTHLFDHLSCLTLTFLFDIVIVPLVVTCIAEQVKYYNWD